MFVAILLFFAVSGLCLVIPYLNRIAVDGYISKGDVERFAKYVGIHPGIVVGRLQHDKKIAHSSMMDMRQKYTIVI